MLWQVMKNAASCGNLEVLQWAVEAYIYTNHHISRYKIYILAQASIQGQHRHIVEFICGIEFHDSPLDREDTGLNSNLNDVPDDWDRVVDLLFERRIANAYSVIIWSIPRGKRDLFGRIESQVNTRDWDDIYYQSACTYSIRGIIDTTAQFLLLCAAERCSYINEVDCFFKPLQTEGLKVASHTMGWSRMCKDACKLRNLDAVHYCYDRVPSHKKIKLKSHIEACLILDSKDSTVMIQACHKKQRII
jgi:hypothetical protein